MALFNRRIRVCFIQADLIIESDEFSINFVANKDIQTMPNSCELRIYNLKAETRNRINILGEDVFISAGYMEDVGTKIVFIGNTLRVLHNRLGPDIVSTIFVGDGATALRETRIRESFAQNTPIASVVSSIAAKLQIGVLFNNVAFLGRFPLGFTHNNLAYKALDRIADRTDTQWFINNRILNFINENGATNASAVNIINDGAVLREPEELLDQGKDFLYELSNSDRNIQVRSRRGLITQPEKNRPEYRIVTLFNPLLEPARTVFVNLPSLNKPVEGRFRVTYVQHVCSSFEEPFYTSVDLEEL